MDTNDHRILAATMTESVRLDGNYLPELINQVEDPKTFSSRDNDVTHEDYFWRSNESSYSRKST
jgi:hypothetical protein